MRINRRDVDKEKTGSCVTEEKMPDKEDAKETEKQMVNGGMEDEEPLSKSAMKKREKMRKLQEYWKEKKKLKKQQKKEKAKMAKKEPAKDGSDGRRGLSTRQLDSGRKGASEGDAPAGAGEVAGGSEDKPPRADRPGLSGAHAAERDQQSHTAGDVQLRLHPEGEAPTPPRLDEREGRNQNQAGEDSGIPFMAREIAFLS